MLLHNETYGYLNQKLIYKGRFHFLLFYRTRCNCYALRVTHSYKYAFISGFTDDCKGPPVKSKKKSNKKRGKQTASATEGDEEDDGITEGAVGSVAGGGRYDNLVTLFTPNSPRVPCVGVSFGIERLLAISEMLARRRAAAGDVDASTAVRATETEVMVIAAHKGIIAPRLQLAQELWDAKIKVCCFLW